MIRGKRAFTLIELLIVLGIILLLAALLLPVANRIREQAKAATCLNNLMQIGKGFSLYTLDNDDQYPDVAQWVYYGDTTLSPNQDTIATGLIPRAMGGNISASIFRCPSDDPLTHPSTPYTYSVNAQLMYVAPTLQTRKVANASQVILAVDESSTTLDDLIWCPSHGGNLLSNRHDRATEDENDPNAGRGNVLYCDYHAEFIPRADCILPIHWLAYPGQTPVP